MLPNSEGRRIPQVTLRVRRDGQWSELATGRIFEGRTVVAFALPGAFTPTCSSSHLPRYNELAATFRRAGVDEIVCISVNDPFVMAEWQKEQDAPNVTFLPDGNGEFTRQMGMLVDKSDLNFGPRSWRYSMLVKDGVIRKMFIEPEKEGDPYEVSDADTMLRYVAPDVTAPEPVLVFAKRGCPYCARAKQLLSERGTVFEEVTLGDGITTSALRAVSGKGTVPQVFIGGRLIGGSEELEKHFAAQDRKAA
ncbi:MAG TPA: glutathione peroxidase [Usitatibacter sp.]|nr:glutathione peroxidase [Usitatibacter sp.]